MTIYHPMPSYKTKNTSKRLRRKNRMSQESAHRARVTRTFSEQWKRYPNSKKVLDLRTGWKTHTGIFPEGYDHTYVGPQWQDMPPIKGGGKASYNGPKVYENIKKLYEPSPIRQFILSDGEVFPSDNSLSLEGRMLHTFRDFVGNSCPGCGKPLSNCLGTSSIYGSQDIGDICEQCFLDEEVLIDTEGTNCPDTNQKIKERLELYRRST